MLHQTHQSGGGKPELAPPTERPVREEMRRFARELHEWLADRLDREELIQLDMYDCVSEIVYKLEFNSDSLENPSFEVCIREP